MTDNRDREAQQARIRANIRRVRQIATEAIRQEDSARGHSGFVEAVTGRRVPREAALTN